METLYTTSRQRALYGIPWGALFTIAAGTIGD